MSLKSTLTLAAALAIGLTSATAAQVVSITAQTVTLNASKGQIVSLGTPSPLVQAIQLTDGATNQYSSAFTITVAWDVVSSTTTTVKLVGYFADPAQALVNGTDYIPSSWIETSIDAGANWVPVTGAAVGTVGTAGASVVLYTSPVTSGGNRNGTHPVSFLVRINLTGRAAVAGNYTGTFNMMAICN